MSESNTKQQSAAEQQSAAAAPAEQQSAAPAEQQSVAPAEAAEKAAEQQATKEDDIDMFYKFIYLFKAPIKDSKMVTINDINKLYNLITLQKDTNETTHNVEIENVSFNEEQFYLRMGKIIKSSYNHEFKNENKISEEIDKIKDLLINNYLIK